MGQDGINGGFFICSSLAPNGRTEDQTLEVLNIAERGGFKQCQKSSSQNSIYFARGIPKTFGAAQHLKFYQFK